MTKLLAVIAVLVLSAAGAVTAIARDGNENPTRARADTATTKVAIVHVRNGCHVWSNGSRNGVAMRLRVKRGANLQITNRDVVPHQLVQLAGPKLRLEGHMMTGKTQLVSFKQRGAYLMFTGGAAVLLPDGVFLPRPSELPDLPWGLVGLTGVSAGTYLLNKSVTTNGLSVDGLATTTVARGQTARILGRNVLPDGSAPRPPEERRGGHARRKEVDVPSVSNSEIVFTVPDDLPTATYDVLVTTAANVSGSAGSITVP